MRSTLLIFFLLLAIPVARADQELSPELITGIELMNNGQFLESHDAIKKYTEEHPKDGKGLFLLAMIKWKIMWISSYTKPERDDLEKLIDRTEGYFSARKDKDTNALFFYTAIIGLRASIATWENQWWDAAQLGKTMKKNAQALVKLDPNNYDSYYLLGSYNYFADALPGYVKFFRTLLFLPSGNRMDGLKQLILANQKGSITAGEAGRALSIIYTYFEKQPEYGVRMCTNVLILYPENYEVGLYKGINIYFQKQWTPSYEWLQHVREQIKVYSMKHENLSDREQGEFRVLPVYRTLDRELQYWMSRSLIQQNRYKEARDILQKLSNPELHQPYWIMRGVFLSLAEIEYEEGHPEKADVLIRKVLKWPDVKDSHEKAKLLKEKGKQIGTFETDLL